MRLHTILLDITIDPDTVEAISQSLEELGSMGVGQTVSKLLDAFKINLPRFGWTLVIFIFGYVFIRMLMRVIKRLMGQSRRVDATLHSFVLSTIKIVLYVLLGLTCVGVLGINITPMIAALGVFGLAVSLAVKDILSNIAGGIAVLFSRPFVKGDYVEINELPGTIMEIGMVYTVLKTIDNKKIYYPNGDVAKAVVINYSAEPIRRLDLTFPIRDDKDFEHAKSIIRSCVNESALVLQDPVPIIRLTDHTYRYVQMSLLVWAKTPDLLELKGQLIGEIRRKLKEEGF